MLRNSIKTLFFASFVYILPGCTSINVQSPSDSLGGACVPTTCDSAKKNCGDVSDGCGGTLQCGICTAPDSCGGGGTENVCGCQSKIWYQALQDIDGDGFFTVNVSSTHEACVAPEGYTDKIDCDDNNKDKTSLADVTFTSIAPGLGHTCALDKDGKAYCWGSNNEGTLGNGGTVNKLTPSTVSMPTADTSFKRISVHYATTCALDPTGAAYCWGHGLEGQIGNGANSPALVPTAVTMPSNEHFSEIAVGSNSICAISANSSGPPAYCWGLGNAGQLGSPVGASNHPIATTATLPNVPLSTITSGTVFSCGLTSSGVAYCWGTGEHGELGNGTLDTKNAPFAVTLPGGVTGFLSIDSGAGFTCALGKDNNTYCWGLASSGQIGNETININDLQKLPVKVTLPDGVQFTQISSGGGHTCAIANNQKTYCWGLGTLGQIGNGLTQNQNRPVEVTMPAGVKFTTIVAGDQYTCAIGDDTKTYCWGLGTSGQLGYGGSENKSTPALVTSQVCQ